MNLKDIKEEHPQEGLEEFTEEFLEDRFLELETINNSVAVDDYTQLFEIAHKWKGFSSPYGFNHLENLAIRILDYKNFQKYPKKEIIEILTELKEYLNHKKQSI
jgi:HPt (histidine-containing phosphotransfer) domain-containing protein